MTYIETELKSASGTHVSTYTETFRTVQNPNNSVIKLSGIVGLYFATVNIPSSHTQHFILDREPLHIKLSAFTQPLLISSKTILYIQVNSLHLELSYLSIVLIIFVKVLIKIVSTFVI